MLLEKIATVLSGNLKGPYFWRYNVHIHWKPTYDGKTIKYRILIKSV
jgi:hypothetical protein